MVNSENTLVKNALNLGALTGIIIAVIQLLLFFIGMGDSMSWLIYLVLIGSIFWGCRQQRDKAGGGYITYGESFLFGFLNAVGASLIFSVVFYLYMKFIDTAYLSQVLEQMEIALYEGDMGDEEIETFMNIYRKMLTPGMLAFGVLFSYIIMGTIISLITSIFIKNPKSIFED
ncbi:MAG: DUF4199 domain-containing protein [Vicingaceae bacterium]